MPSVSKDQLADLLKATPPGTNAHDVIDKLHGKGYTIEGIDDAAAAAPPDTGQAPAAAAAPAAPQAPQTSPLQQIGGQLADALPAAGGMLGGAAGGFGGTVFGAGVGGIPGAIGGAALGGAGGEAMKQLADRAMGLQSPQSSGEAASQIGTQGAVQGAFDAVGHGIAAGLGQIAKPVMQFAVGLAQKGSTDLAKTALENGISASPAGVKKLMGIIGDKGQAIMALARQAGQQGAQLHPIRLVSKFQDLMDAASQTALPKTAQRSLTEEYSRFLDENIPGGWPPPKTIKTQGQFNNWIGGAMMKPERLVALKRSADGIADPLLKAMEKKEVVPELDQLRARFYKSVADEARGQLNSIPALTPGGQSMAELNQAEQHLIRLKNQIAPASLRARTVASQAAPAAAFATIGGMMPGTPTQKVEHALLGAAVGHPAVMSNVALGLNNPMIAQLIPQLLRTGQVAMQPPPQVQQK